jgi:hypothetical protein
MAQYSLNNFVRHAESVQFCGKAAAKRMPAMPLKFVPLHCGSNDISRQCIQINWIPLRALEHQPTPRISQQLAVQIEALFELCDNRHRRPALPSLRLLTVASPVRGFRGAASIALAAGVSPKVVSEQLGDASTAFTLDTYAHVLPHMQDEAAARVEAVLLERQRDESLRTKSSAPDTLKRQ